MPNKLTDAEVKKALECYRGQKLFAFNGKRPEIYIHDIIDLINRQEAEIKHLDIESDILRADVENLNRINDELNAENESLKAEVKAEAYKEFAELIKEQMRREYYSEYAVDRILNGLVGDGDGKRKD